MSNNYLRVSTLGLAAVFLSLSIAQAQPAVVVPVAENITASASDPALPSNLAQEYKRLAEEEAKLLRELSVAEHSAKQQIKAPENAQPQEVSLKSSESAKEAAASLLSKEPKKDAAQVKSPAKAQQVKSASAPSETKLITSLQGANLDLVNKLKQREGQVSELEQEVDELRQRLMRAETEVERLRAHLDQRNRASLSPFLNQGAKAQLPQAPAAKRLALAAQAPSEADLPILTVTVEKAALRAGPGAENSELMSVRRGTRLTVETRSPDGAWFRVFAPNGTRAWVSADVVGFNSNTPLAAQSARKEGESSSPYGKEAESRAFENLKLLKKPE